MAKEGYQKVANKKDLPEGGLFKVEPQDRHIYFQWLTGKSMQWMQFAHMKVDL